MLEMASSSSTASQIQYDIFLSFRGTDTRRGFLGHLVKALNDKQIKIFVDYMLKEGTKISDSLLTAIKQSQISLIIFSKDYASSKWCLNELVKIIECMKLNGQIAIPVFYGVDPSCVRKQNKNYQIALADHEKTSSEDEVKKWRKALKEAADLSGLTSTSFGNDAELIDEVVKRVLERLNQPCQTDLQGPVGIHEPVAQVESLLCRESEAVLIIGLWGMGGIGKTTLASAVFNSLCHKFQGSCFLENVREGVEKNGINHLKKELLSKLLGEKDANPYIIPNGITNFAKTRLGRKDVLVVLDDVSDSDQLIDLCGGHDWFGPTSRIMVTTRDRQVLVNEADHIYEVKPLKSDESLQLFKFNAFRRNYIRTEQVELPMIMRVVDYAEGIPLALKVLGSSLCGKSKEEWGSQLSKLEKMPDRKIQKILRLSYDELDRDDQNILLYLACFFETIAEEQVKYLLDSCGYSTAIGLRNLQDKALISISRSYVTMHDLIREMGREIVRQESTNDPGKRSRLWDPSDIYKVLKYNRGTEAIESITLNMSKIQELSLHPQAFARMYNLKFLNIHSFDQKNRLCATKGIESMSDELRIFHWDNYPSKSLPLSFCAENLVEFIMPHSKLEKLWEGVQNLVNLKKVDLNWSSKLIQLPDFSKASNLESVNVSNCKSLSQVLSSAVSSNKLAYLTLNDCEKLTSFQHNINLQSLMTLSLCDCSSLTEFSLTTSESTSSSTRLESANYTLPTPLYKLNLDYCQNLSLLPENINMLSSLEHLSLCHSDVRTLPESIKHLSQLRYLNLTNCDKLQSLPELPSSIEELIAVDCTSLETVFSSNSMDELEEEQQEDETFAFANCMKLEEAAINTIVENARIRIKRAACACLAATTDEYYVDGRRAIQTYYHRVRVCLPGRQVPSWFSYKMTQASMTIELVPPAAQTSRFLGFILCVVFPQNDEKVGDLEYLGCDYRVESSDGQSAPYGISNARTVFPRMFIWENNRSDNQSVTYKSMWFLKHRLLDKEGINSNVYLWYDGQCCLDIMRGMKQSKANDGDSSVVDHNLKVSFRFYYVRGWKEHGMGIKQCGVHPIYASDILNLGEQWRMESALGVKSQRIKEEITEFGISSIDGNQGDLEEPLFSANKRLKKE